MNRRRFLREGLASGVLVAGSGGFLLARRARGRQNLTGRMLDEALPPFAEKCLGELNALPVDARGRIAEYFHGRCLNVQGFVEHVFSAAFVERLGRCRDREEREACLLQAFFERVATAAEILNRVEAGAAEAGAGLDAAWSSYCVEVNARWSGRVAGFGPALSFADLSERLDRLIRKDLHDTVRALSAAHHQPAVGETIGKIGESALKLVEVVPPNPYGLAVAVPVFFLLAARPVWEFILARLEDRRGEFQGAVSGRLTTLGRRVGAEFEREVRRHLTDLHAWQERALRETARRVAEERVGLV